MARHLDLEEQEQLANLKHFWNQYGDFITWVLIAVFGTIASWNGWQYWQRSQATQAAALYDEVERAAEAGDVARVGVAVGDLKDKFGSTTYAQQAGLLAARVLLEKGNADGAKTALGWVAEKASDEGYQASARLRLADLSVGAKAYDEALKHLAGTFPKSYEALAADRRGDIYVLQGKKAEAKAEYQKAWQGLDERIDYRNIVEVKLNALGVDPRGASKTAAPAAAAKT
ncbi:MAG: tetratricopeptide repeat protein [Burkholderiales bacterium]|nr:tetratricopeptide repeat protein [Burkholderiales bacterium]